MINSTLAKYGYEKTENAEVWLKCLAVPTVVGTLSFGLVGAAMKAHRYFLAGTVAGTALGLALLKTQRIANLSRVRNHQIDFTSALPRILVGSGLCWLVGRYLMTRPIAFACGNGASSLGVVGSALIFKLCTQPKPPQETFDETVRAAIKSVSPDQFEQRHVEYHEAVGKAIDKALRPLSRWQLGQAGWPWETLDKTIGNSILEPVRAGKIAYLTPIKTPDSNWLVEMFKKLPFRSEDSNNNIQTLDGVNFLN